MAVFRQQVGEFHRAPGVEDQYQGQARFVQGAQVGHFPVAEQVVPRRGGAVLALAGDAADHIDGRGGADQVLQGHRTALRQHKGVGRIGVKGIFHLGGIVQDLVLPGQTGRGVAVFIVGDPVFAGKGDPGFLQPLIKGDIGPVVHIAGADAALDGIPGAGTEEGHRFVGGQGQHAVVAQQDDARGGCLAGQGGVAFFPGGGGSLEAAAVAVCRLHKMVPLEMMDRTRKTAIAGYYDGLPHYRRKKGKAVYSLTPPRVMPAMMYLDSSR